MGNRRGAYRVFVGGRKGPFGRLRPRREDNIEILLQEVEW
jgi:hypothetical protein